MSYKTGIIGCGLIGNKRAAALQKIKDISILKVIDENLNKAQDLASKCNCMYSNDWKDLVDDEDINLIIVATTNDKLAEITIEMLKKGKHVLVEKPAGRNPDEIKKIIDVYENLGKKYKVKVGFNHRFHPAFEKAKQIIKTENIGDVMFIRARYGHGGRLGYDEEWRSFKDMAGGGEMLDQGSHIVDLSRYFMGDFKYVTGFCATYFWDMEVEDNCFALLKTEKGEVAQLHASCTQWKNIFSMEIFCRTGQINIDGLGGSYGVETLTFYKMKPEMGIPDKFVFSWDGEDLSWIKEIENFIESIEYDIEPNGNIYDAYESIKLIYKLYEKCNNDGF